MVILGLLFSAKITDDWCWTGERQSLDQTKDKQLDDEAQKMSADNEDNAKRSGGLIFNLFSVLIMFVMLFLFSTQQSVT